MSSPNARVPLPPDWRKLPALFKEWREVVVIIAGALTAAFTTIGVKAQGIARIIGYAVTLILFGVGGYVTYRVKRRREIARQRAQLRETFENRKLQRTTFRGLYPYQEGDVLPGHRRKREAQTIFTQVTDPNFSFGVICGDSGCGKTSVLRCALKGYLKETKSQTGLNVLYVGSLRELGGEPGRPDGSTAGDRLGQQLAKLRQDAEQAGEGAPVVIIIDQFEEFFIEYETELRAHLGACLNALIHATPPARILCAIRRDYLMDMRDLAPQLPEPFSIKTLFGLTNFTPEQAADVIRECAALDGVTLDAGLPAIIAEDLAEGGRVRPPELQIVCTALISEPTIAEYRLRGGARGILAHHIQNSVAICDDPALGNQILRALCDFPSHSKSNPQTISEILAALNLPSGLGHGEATRVVTDILTQFEAARIVQIERRANEDSYSLVHDYLVNSVAAATGDEKTRVEKANQLLQYYIAERSDDPKTRIPFRRYRFIKKHADEALLNDRHARRLLKATRNARVVYIMALLVLILISTGALLTALNTHRTWEPTVLNRLFPETGSVPIDGNILPVKDGRQVLSIMETTEAKYVKLWDSKTADLLLNVKCDDYLLGKQDQILIVEDKSAHSVYAVRLATGETYQLPVSAAAIDASHDLDELVRFGQTDEVILIAGEKGAEDKAPRAGGPPPPPVNRGIKIWSVIEGRPLAVIDSASWSMAPPPYLDKKASRLLAVHWSDLSGRWALWDAQTGEPIIPFADYKDDPLDDFAVDETGGRFAVVKRSPDRQLYVQIGDLQTGKLLLGRLVDAEAPPVTTRVGFSDGGDFIVLWASNALNSSGKAPVADKPLAVLNSSDLLPAQYCAGKDLNWAYPLGPQEGLGMIYWSSDLGTHAWNLTTKPPQLFPGLVLHPLEREDGTMREKLIVAQASGRAIVRRQDWRRELYDLNDGRKIGDLGTPIPDWGMGYNLNGQTLDIFFPDGTEPFYTLENGRRVAELRNSANLVAFYDAECNRITAWTRDGQVVRYTESMKILGRWNWSLDKCHD